MKPPILITAFSLTSLVCGSFSVLNEVPDTEPTASDVDQTALVSEVAGGDIPGDVASTDPGQDSTQPSADGGTIQAEADFFDIDHPIAIDVSDALTPSAAAAGGDPMQRDVYPKSTFNPYGYWWPARCTSITNSMQTTSTLEEAVAIVNETRAYYGIPTLVTDPALVNSATVWSQKMASSLPVRTSCGGSLCPPTTYKHDPLLDSVINLGYRKAAENIRWFASPSGFQRDSSAAAVCGWLGSATGHREALLSTKYTAIGVGGVQSGTDFLYTSHLGGDHVNGTKSSQPVIETPVVVNCPDNTLGTTNDHLIVRRGAAYYFRYTMNAGPYCKQVVYGKADDVTYIGDWDGDGVDGIAVRRGNEYFFKNVIGPGAADYSLIYGRPTDDVLVGDWDGDGKDTLTVRRGSEYFIANSLTRITADAVIVYGKGDDTVLVGDWDGDGKDTFAVRRGSEYHVKNSMTPGIADSIFVYGRATDEVLVGDWDGDRKDTFTVRRGNEFFVNNALRGGEAAANFVMGDVGDAVMVGKMR